MGDTYILYPQPIKNVLILGLTKFLGTLITSSIVLFNFMLPMTIPSTCLSIENPEKVPKHVSNRHLL
jgi:hypothetical protein